jgi:SET domain-containing protein
MIGTMQIPENLEMKWVNAEIGYGMFTTKPILKNDIVEICYCLEMYGIKENVPIFDYLFTHPITKNQLLAFGYGSIYNHSSKSNIIWSPIKDNNKFILFSATRDIDTGEELTHNYGTSYWEIKPRKLL